MCFSRGPETLTMCRRVAPLSLITWFAKACCTIQPVDQFHGIFSTVLSDRDVCGSMTAVSEGRQQSVAKWDGNATSRVSYARCQTSIAPQRRVKSSWMPLCIRVGKPPHTAVGHAGWNAQLGCCQLICMIHTGMYRYTSIADARVVI